MKRRPIDRNKRWRILERDFFTCRYCGHEAPDVKLEIDHVVPVSKGGSNDDSNLVTACRDCNGGKRAQLLTEDYILRGQPVRNGFSYAADQLNATEMEDLVVRCLSEAIINRDPKVHYKDRIFHDWVRFFEGLEREVERLRLEEEARP